MKRFIYLPALISAMNLVGCAVDHSHSPAPKPSAPELRSEKKPDPESIYADLFFKRGGTCESGMDYTIQETSFKSIGFNPDGSETFARILLALGSNHVFEVEYMESDHTPVPGQNLGDWSKDRNRYFNGRWELRKNELVLSSFAVIVADPSDPTHFELRPRVDLMRPGLKEQVFALSPDVFHFAPFPDLDPCKK